MMLLTIIVGLMFSLMVGLFTGIQIQKNEQLEKERGINND